MNNKEVLKMVMMIGIMILILFILNKMGLLYIPFFKPKVM